MATEPASYCRAEQFRQKRKSQGNVLQSAAGLIWVRLFWRDFS
jgi:hypothetical protein